MRYRPISKLMNGKYTVQPMMSRRDELALYLEGIVLVKLQNYLYNSVFPHWQIIKYSSIMLLCLLFYDK